MHLIETPFLADLTSVVPMIALDYSPEVVGASCYCIDSPRVRAVMRCCDSVCVMMHFRQVYSLAGLLYTRSSRGIRPLYKTAVIQGKAKKSCAYCKL